MLHRKIRRSILFATILFFAVIAFKVGVLYKSEKQRASLDAMWSGIGSDRAAKQRSSTVGNSVIGNASVSNDGTPSVLSEGVEEYTYLRFVDMDNACHGDFSCTGSLSQSSCSLSMKTVTAAEQLCDRMGIFCRGFVRMRDGNQTIVYFKRMLGVFREAKGKNIYVKQRFSGKMRFATDQS